MAGKEQSANFDEPFQGVDIQARRDIGEFIRKL